MNPGPKTQWLATTFLKIIHELEHANVFVISHKTDSLIDKFHHVITFEKQRGFSAIKA